MKGEGLCKERFKIEYPSGCGLLIELLFGTRVLGSASNLALLSLTTVDLIYDGGCTCGSINDAELHKVKMVIEASASHPNTGE